MIAKRLITNSADNMLFVLGSMMIHILSARLMTSEEFGYFTSVFTFFVLAQAISLSFIHEPFIKYSDISDDLKANSLMIILLYKLIYWSGILFFLIFSFFFIFGFEFFSAPDYLLVCLCMSLSIAYQFTRRIHHFVGDGVGGVFSSTIFASTSSLFLLGSITFDINIDFQLAVTSIGIASLLGLAYNLRCLKVFDANARDNFEIDKDTLLNVRSGVVVLSGNIIFFLISNAYVPLLLLFSTLSDIGNLRIIFLILMPLNHLIASLNTLALTQIKQKLGDVDEGVSARVFVLRVFTWTAVLSLVYGCVVLFWFADIVWLIFGKDIPLNLFGSLSLLVLPALSVCNLPFSMYLRLIFKQSDVAISAMLGFAALLTVFFVGVTVDWFNALDLILVTYVCCYFFVFMSSALFFRSSRACCGPA